MPKVKDISETNNVKQPWEMSEEEFAGCGKTGIISEREKLYEQQERLKTALWYGEAAGYSTEDIVRRLVPNKRQLFVDVL